MKHSILLTSNTTLQDVVQALDAGGIGFLAFVDGDNSLLGIVTDGDLRRSILRKTSDINQIINRTPETMVFGSSNRDIVSRLKSLHRRHMPLVNEKNQLCSVFSLDEIEFVSRNNYVVLMAGGLGSRLGELTKDLPKPMLKIGDRPMLQHLVEQFRDQGFSKFIFCLNYKKEIIREYFSDGKKLGVSIEYVEENQPLGTAGALSLIRQEMLTEPFFVVNADVLTSLDFNEALKYHIEKGSVATMCVRQFQHQVPYGVVTSNENQFIQEIKEKPIYPFDVNAGIYVMNPGALRHVPENTYYNMTTLFEKLISKKLPCAMFRLLDYWVDIGRKEDLLRASEDISLDNCPKGGSRK
ncbi:nucleotidyltransferase family protein [Bdellovibrio bacteriovorus]